MIGRSLSVLVLLLAAAACDQLQTPAQRAAAAQRDSLARDSLARVATLAAADSLAARTPKAEWPLPFASVAGITITPSGRLLAADGESGNVSEVDQQTGRVVKTFRLGRQPVRDDLVGITTTENGDVFELSRDGAVYHFLEGGDGNRVEFLRHETRLGRVCDFGGVAFDKARNSLLLACRTMKSAGDSLSLFWWRLDRQVDRVSEFRIPNPNGLQPEEVTLDPVSHNYVLFAPKQNTIAEITPTGQLVFAVKGPADLSSMRGAAITKGTVFLMAKETATGASLARYHWR